MSQIALLFVVHRYEIPERTQARDPQDLPRFSLLQQQDTLLVR